MPIALQRPWTEERFLIWADAQDERFEFDGVEPVAMTGGTVAHGLITTNILTALRVRLRGKRCSSHGPNLGVRTIGARIRFPDALITCERLHGSDRIAPNPLIVFEVLSPTSGGTDRIEKVREYAAVASIRRYVIVESASIGLLVLHRASGDAAWETSALTNDDTLDLPEAEIAVPVAAFYEDVEFER